MNILKIKQAAEIAKSRTDDKRWLAAIDKAVAGVESGWWIITELFDCLAITTETGNTYFANGVCSCEAYKHSTACKHRSLYRLYEIARELPEETAEAVSLADEDETPSIATAEKPFDEDFYSDEFSEYGQSLFARNRPHSEPSSLAADVADDDPDWAEERRYIDNHLMLSRDPVSTPAEVYCSCCGAPSPVEYDTCPSCGVEGEWMTEEEVFDDEVAASSRVNLIAEIKNIWPRFAPGLPLAVELMARFRVNKLEMLDDDCLRRVRLAISM